MKILLKILKFLKKNDELKDTVLESPYSMSYKFNYGELLEKIDNMEAKILNNIANESIDNTDLKNSSINNTEESSSINNTVITFGSLGITKESTK